jgi:hypothetical protein
MKIEEMKIKKVKKLKKFLKQEKRKSKLISNNGPNNKVQICII